MNSILTRTLLRTVAVTTALTLATTAVSDTVPIGYEAVGEAVESAACDLDLDGNGWVDASDILGLFRNWGPCPGGGPVGGQPAAECVGDLDGDGRVGFDDLMMLLGGFGTQCKI